MKLLIFALIAFSLSAHAGNESRGTEDAVIQGLKNKRYLDTTGLAYFEYRKEQIAELLKPVAGQPSLMQNFIAEFFRAVNEGDLFAPNQGVPDMRPLYGRLKQQGAAEAILKSKIVFSNKCIDAKGEERTATTMPVPGTDICINLERFALLEMGLTNTYFLAASYNGADRDVGSFANSFVTYNRPTLHLGYLFGLLMHETARQYNEDDDHEFFLAMIPEVYRHYVFLPSVSKQLNVEQLSYPVDERDGGGFNKLLVVPDYAVSADVTLQVNLADGTDIKCLENMRASLTTYKKGKVTVDQSKNLDGKKSQNKRSITYSWNVDRLKIPHGNQVLVDLSVPGAGYKNPADYRKSNGAEIQRKCTEGTTIALVDYEHKTVFANKIINDFLGLSPYGSVGGFHKYFSFLPKN